jgi:histidine ammonia-lyase
MAPGEPCVLDGGPLSIELVRAVAVDGRPVRLADSARAAIEASRRGIDRVAAGTAAVYGVNTGFGSLAQVRVAAEGLRDLQRNLVLSHAAGLGDPLPPDVVRGMLLLLAASLCRGRSGVRPVVIERLIELLNHGLTPVVPERGSVGASGDLAPLAHACLPLLGEGEVWLDGHPAAADEALRSRGLAPIALEAKEGLALLNGTHLMAARGALAFAAIEPLLETAIGAAAMSVDACLASDSPLDARLHAARHQPGQAEVAQRMRNLLSGSGITASHRENDPRVQDPYSLRCAPQVLGAALDQLRAQRAVIERELGAVTDNPLVLPDGKGGFDVVSGGNFHGMPLAVAMDAAKIALCHVAGISERRTFWVLSGHDRFNPVKPCLAGTPGVESGLMIVQYAAAACVNELQTLAHPASVGNVGTCGGIEDYNSFGPLSGWQLDRAVRLTREVVAIELLVMAQAIETHRPNRSGEGVERLHAEVRRHVAPMARDRSPAADMAVLARAIAAGDFRG